MEEKIAEISQTIKTQRNGDKKKESKAPEKKEKSMASSMRKKITFTAQSLIKDRLMKRLAEVDPIKEHKKRKTPIVYEKVKTMTLNQLLSDDEKEEDEKEECQNDEEAAIDVE